ncbi:hypothetical protein TIFTF001_029281 [Ficus carica]|uniref:Reverse transcriptase zinc-binding domain-containing protein n=1 Tax=Ficus carica TaxID=3494 RepID=A0AA88J1D0_FICCA|nr:hypothetical protein TIFTF001_029281 [Ficus carica]
MTGWDQEPISRVLWEVDHAVVRSIPLSARRSMDRLRVQESCSERSGEVSWWNKLWATRIPSKVKIHVWRAYHSAIPARAHLAHRGIHIDLSCPRCGPPMEDAHHALRACEGVRVIWEGTALWQNLKRFGGGPLSERCLFVASNCTKDDLEVFCMVLWSI